jgi:hypothetical protein
VPEEVTSLEAMAYVQGPRQGKGESPFIRVWVPEQQANKRARMGPLQQSFAGPIGDSQGIMHTENLKKNICENIFFPEKRGTRTTGTFGPFFPGSQ